MQTEKSGRLRVLILTDLEGISGIERIEDVDREKKEYGESCKKLMLDVNAAAEGAFSGGASGVYALDGHGGGKNFLPGMLDKRAMIEERRMTKALSAGKAYEAVAVIGAHAMAGTINGFLDHTQSSKSWFNYYVNGRKLGEIAQWALWAGLRDIPVIMVSGDEAACAEARAFLGNVETAPVKQGLGRNRALLYPETESRKKITKAVKKAVKNYKNFSPFKMFTPLDIRLELYRSDMADEIISRRPDYERIDARTIRRVSDNPLDILF